MPSIRVSSLCQSDLTLENNSIRTVKFDEFTKAALLSLMIGQKCSALGVLC